MDEVGAMSAMRHAGRNCVTAHINKLDFSRPIPQGNTCVIESYAYATGRTSIRVRLRAFNEDPRTGTFRFCPVIPTLAGPLSPRYANP
jgi:acyl-CoA hydrolase